jgi:hypothetical protein
MLKGVPQRALVGRSEPLPRFSLHVMPPPTPSNRTFCHLQLFAHLFPQFTETSKRFCQPNPLSSNTKSFRLSHHELTNPTNTKNTRNNLLKSYNVRRRQPSVELTREPNPSPSFPSAPWHPAAMAPMKSPQSNHSSSNYGEGIVRQANILASCYIVDSSTASLNGLHYCTTGLSGAEWYS